MKTSARFAPLALVLSLAACNTGGLGASSNGPFAPGVDYNKQAVDGLIVGDRLMEAGEYELALEAYIRAAGEHGLTPDVVTSIGAANLGLGRLGQAEKQFRDVLKENPDRPDALNNLGVVLLETNRTPEAVQVFRKAYALDNGQSDSIRDNLRLSLAKMENPSYDVEQQEFKLVRRGRSDYVIRQTP